MSELEDARCRAEATIAAELVAQNQKPRPTDVLRDHEVRAQRAANEFLRRVQHTPGAKGHTWVSKTVKVRSGVLRREREQQVRLAAWEFSNGGDLIWLDSEGGWWRGDLWTHYGTRPRSITIPGDFFDLGHAIRNYGGADRIIADMGRLLAEGGW